ncbi:uncharacterized protein BJ171DRAFT_564098 [Polychytrium aggregatum]|uniref:uncharacterized protein n=1 Tax=Polychytrium aggregatum TaxID=110093 RepID=UPI0022FE6E4F|nr:uncharacterized protein BJ171DRAFT_564098 [Polychytrium aggregatum]KAI9209537.1 hypothetical protein BJ171DRAFT_564098 [Polychytrium aggregatum]
MNPVDHVARVIAAIAASPESLFKFVFHVSNSDNSTLAEKKLFELVNAYGWPVLFETREVFLTILQNNPSPESNALFPLMHMMMDMSFRVESKNTQSIYPAPSAPAVEVAAKCLVYLFRAGFLPRPINPPTPLKEEEYPEVSIFGRTGRH